MAAFDGQVVIVTGAGGGIGSETVQRFAQEGAKLVAADIVDEGARRAADLAKAEGAHAIAVPVDLADEASIAAMIEAAVKTFGRLDVLVNNAALQTPEYARRDLDVETMETEVWDMTYRVNARGTMLACKYALPHLVAAGGGSIINVTSNLGLQGQIIQAAYSSTKAAILQMTRSIAASHGRKGVRCNAVSPGLTLSPAARGNLPPELLEIVEGETLTPYLGEPIDIAEAILYAASPAARYVNGHNLVVDGGTSVHVPGYARFRTLFGAKD